MNKENILYLIGGMAAGFVAGVFATKKYFEKKYKEKYEADHESLADYYRRVDDYDRKNDKEPQEGDSQPGGRMTKEEREDVKKKLDQNRQEKTLVNYAGMYHGHIVEPGKMEDSAEEGPEEDDEHPLDQGEEGEIDPDDEQFQADLDHFEEHQKNKNKKPRIISEDTYSNLPPSIDQETLYFYAYDETLCDENEEMISEPERFVGDALTKYNFIESDERVIFVMNYELDTCYEIQKLDASWTEEH